MARRKKLPSRVVDYDTLSNDLKIIYDKLYAEYDKKNLPELREEARLLTVESPTTLGKDALVKRMTDWIISDYLSPHIDEKEFDALHRNDGTHHVGIYECRGGQMRIDGNIVVPAHIARDGNLRDGDLVYGTVAGISGVKTLTSVIDVDGEKVSKERRWFAEIPAAQRRKFELPPVLATMFPGLEMGERVIFRNMMLEQALEMVRLFGTTIALFAGVEPEYETIIDSKNSQFKFAIPFDCPRSEGQHVARLALTRAKRLCEWGRDVVMIIYGFDGLDDRDIERAIFGAGRCFEKGSLTIITDLNPERNNGVYAKASTRII